MQHAEGVSVEVFSAFSIEGSTWSIGGIEEFGFPSGGQESSTVSIRVDSNGNPIIGNGNYNDGGDGQV